VSRDLALEKLEVRWYTYISSVRDACAKIQYERFSENGEYWYNGLRKALQNIS